MQRPTLLNFRRLGTSLDANRSLGRQQGFLSRIVGNLSSPPLLVASFLWVPLSQFFMPLTKHMMQPATQIFMPLTKHMMQPATYDEMSIGGDFGRQRNYVKRSIQTIFILALRQEESVRPEILESVTINPWGGGGGGQLNDEEAPDAKLVGRSLETFSLG